VIETHLADTLWNARQLRLEARRAPIALSVMIGVDRLTGVAP